MNIGKKSLVMVFCVVSVVLMMTSGCAELQRSSPVKQRYILDVNRDSEKSAQRGDVVKVRRFRVSSRFEGSELIYRTGQVNYESDFYNEFLTSPASIITEEVRRWLGQSGLFAEVVDTSSRLKADFLLEGNVSAFYGDDRNRAEPFAVIEIEFFLIDAAGVTVSTAFHEIYEINTPVESNSPQALVKSLSRCLEQILETFEEDLQKTLL